MADEERPRPLAFLTDGDLVYLDTMLGCIAGFLPEVTVAVEAELLARNLTTGVYLEAIVGKVLEALELGQRVPEAGP